MRFSFLMTVMLAGCGSKLGSGDAGVSSDDEPVVSDHGTDGRYSWTPETVFDATTKLTWERHGSERLSLDAAEKYCAGLGERVPTREELLTILTGDREPAPFVDSGDWYWSSTRSANVANAAWVVGIARYTNTHAIETTSRVRCVR